METNLRTLKKQHSENIKWFRNLDKTLEKENREQTADEFQEYEKRFKETESLKDKIERQEKHKSLLLEKTWESEIPKSEKRKYSFTNALKILCDKLPGNSYEREVSQELEKRSKTGNGGFLIPTVELFGETTYPEREKRIIDNETAIIDSRLRPELTLLGLYENSIMDQLRCTKVSAEGDFNFQLVIMLLLGSLVRKVLRRRLTK